MDTALCDELLQDIFLRLPPPSLAVVPLVSKRWRRLLRSSTTSLSLQVRPLHTAATITSFAAFLTQHPYLSSLTISGGDAADDLLFLAVASSCPNLRHVRCSSSPASNFSLYTLSISCIHLSSMAIALSRPLSFNWLPLFKSLKSLSLDFTNPLSETLITQQPQNAAFDVGLNLNLNLESLSLCGISPGDYGLGFLWKNCKNLNKLKLKSCESVGDYPSFSEFLASLSSLQELELRTCRSIVDFVLLTLVGAKNSLDSLLIYDGASKESLLQFINQSSCRLKELDLRLPLDLDNSHLTSITENPSFRGLVSLRLQSCCLFTGDGLKSLGRAFSGSLTELALVNCDVVNREPGFLTDLGQSLRSLRKLDLSYNDMLIDNELLGMLASCSFLIELRLRCCGLLTGGIVGSIIKCCKKLESVDVTCCSRIKTEGVDILVLNLPVLRRVEVEESQVSVFARNLCSNKFIEIVT
ncbi:RNI-like superfamily protein [Striga hermonthica]|uniref:RNI-like superfamily protein n=1 Tax=Striga hermonthica TaxID=68872 RepID=A0A9N7N155_STRHE|nr:RNI-like superfamily protein [Striga hermonthica]